MNIKRIIKISFLLVIVLVFIIATINQVLLKKVEYNNSSKDFISNMVVIQENMNRLVLDCLLVENSLDLEKIEIHFKNEEKEFEKIKDEFLNKKTDAFFSKFLEDIHKNKNILKDLQELYKNEKKIEESFKNIYELQKQKIKFLLSFKKEYPLENKIRKQLEEVIWNTDDIKLLKEFANLKYYSKEALYQHKNEKYLKKWIDSAISLQTKTSNNLFDEYIYVLKLLSSHILNLNEIEQKEERLKRIVENVLDSSHDINTKLQKNIEETLNDFLESSNTIILLISILTILFIIILALKVYSNIGLSVDEIESKVQKGLRKIKSLNKEIEITQKEVVFTMGAIGETRSKETGNHVKRVAEYSKLLAKHYGLSDKEAEMLKQASPMHDIGKVAIPDSILNKPGRFNDEEREIMNTHAKIGYEMLKHSKRDLLKCAAIVAYEHHEKWDGSGYPRGLAGENIHIYGRITALADVFDALGSDRCYKKAWEDERIFKLFKEERGKHFDPKLVDIFFEYLEEFLEIRKKFKDV